MAWYEIEAGTQCIRHGSRGVATNLGPRWKQGLLHLPDPHQLPVRSTAYIESTPYNKNASIPSTEYSVKMS